MVRKKDSEIELKGLKLTLDGWYGGRIVSKIYFHDIPKIALEFVFISSSILALFQIFILFRNIFFL